ncbi:LysR substrate-binding domain-containing protein [Rhodoligotrophos defluvii]|uniref:LysR substrate-binding domain-containing protein n=1 Tax=Rhodoligotrophos defluvii TaxID=2561934 RepID=UPI00148523FD|nr:LysR substrate-binding domain-containing protein [Rhodoligotrophos defluvii]
MRLPNLRQLHMFRILMQTQNVTEAARQLNVTQPAVSKMIASLESSLGVRLFRRVRGRLYPSGDASRLLIEVERLFVQLEALNDGMDGLRSSQAGTVAISAIPSLASSVVASCLADFARERPHIRTLLMSENSANMINQVGLHQVDLGFMYNHPGPDKSLTAELVAELEVVGVLHKDHPLAENAVLTPQLLESHPVILWEQNTPPSQLVREAFLREGLVPRDRFETNTSSVAKAMAARGIGVALIDPTIMLGDPEQGLVMRTFRPRIPLRIFCIQSIYRPASQLAHRFLEEFRLTMNGFAAQLQLDHDEISS